jgi:hypothetical protein
MPKYFDEKECERKEIRIDEQRGKMILDIRQCFVPEDGDDFIFTKKGVRTAGTPENVLLILGLIAAEAREVLGVTDDQIAAAVTAPVEMATKKKRAKK